MFDSYSKLSYKQLFNYDKCHIVVKSHFSKIFILEIYLNFIHFYTCFYVLLLIHMRFKQYLLQII